MNAAKQLIIILAIWFFGQVLSVAHAVPLRLTDIEAAWLGFLKLLLSLESPTTQDINRKLVLG